MSESEWEYMERGREGDMTTYRRPKGPDGPWERHEWRDYGDGGEYTIGLLVDTEDLAAPTGLDGEDLARTGRIPPYAIHLHESMARAWHQVSDHAKDGTAFGGHACNCSRVAQRAIALRWLPLGDA